MPKKAPHPLSGKGADMHTGRESDSGPISPYEYKRWKAQDRRVVLAGDFDKVTAILLEATEPPAEASESNHEVD
jgi:hypothetical protein